MIKNIGTQLWVTNEKRDRFPLSEELIQPVGEGHLGVKGKGGLWTSTYLGKEEGSDWIQWCLGSEFGLPMGGIWKGYLLEPKKDLRLYTIDSLEEMHILFDKYGYQMYPQVSIDHEGIYWERMAQDYDALLLTEYGEAVTRHSGFFARLREKDKNLKAEWKARNMRSFYGWDCESTFHFRWNFTSVEPIELNLKHKDIFDEEKA